jgi:hypothetical protein
MRRVKKRIRRPRERRSQYIPRMHCEPVFAVISARFSWTAKVLWIAALLALAARKEIFLPGNEEENYS